MAEKKKKYTSEWKSFSELKSISHNISEMGYKREYIEKHKLEEKKLLHWSNMTNGVMCFREPLEVKVEDGKLLWRYNENYVHMDVPETFETQLGIFNNHNHGEFPSWLGRDGAKIERKPDNLFYQNDFLIDGNYCDMFDCGEYSYAISNLQHMVIGRVKIVRLDKDFEVKTLFENDGINPMLEYVGRFKNEEGFVVIVSGYYMKDKDEKKEFQRLITLLQIDDNGNCSKRSEWEISISSINSMAVLGDYVYFGQNKMVTQLNILTSEIIFFTNKTDEEMAALTGV